MENDKKKTFSLHHQGCINDYPLAFGTSLHLKACNFNKYNCIIYMARLRYQENRRKDLVFFIAFWSQLNIHVTYMDYLNFYAQIHDDLSLM